MNLGFASVYSARPIPHFVAYLESLARDAGARTCVLTCDGAAGTCSNHLLRDRHRWVECGTCMAGGLRSFPLGKLARIRESADGLADEVAWKLAYSSAITLSREESTESFSGPVVRGLQERLVPGIRAAYASALAWIRREKLDAVLVYNGRMDLTAAVCEACRAEGIRFVTIERSSLVGHGIWLVPDRSCLSLRDFNAMAEDYSRQPLTERQVRRAAVILARKLARRTDLEWRVYNRNAVETVWPQLSGRRKVLILPSSRNELEGNDEWASDMVDLEKTLPEFFARTGITPEDCVVRGHPLWAERVGKVACSPANEWWRGFCAKRRLTYLPSESRASTQSLIQQADLIVVNASFAAIEAGALGKPIVCFGHSHYERSGLATMISSPSDWAKLDRLSQHDPRAVIQATLRFVYTIGWRFPQFVDFVRGRTATDYTFLPGGDPQRLMNLLSSGRLVADDVEVATTSVAEEAVIDQFARGDGAECTQWEEADPAEGTRSVIQRRWALRLVDPLRRLMPKGDY